MRHKHQCECMDKKCRTIVLGPDNQLEGISCPRCGGPVWIKPFKQHEERVNDNAFKEIKLIIGDVYEPPKLFIDGIDKSKAIDSIDYKYRTDVSSHPTDRREHSATVTYWEDKGEGDDKPYRRTIGVSNMHLD